STVDDAAKVNNNILPPTDLNDPIASGSVDKCPLKVRSCSNKDNGRGDQNGEGARQEDEDDEGRGGSRNGGPSYEEAAAIFSGAASREEAIPQHNSSNCTPEEARISPQQSSWSLSHSRSTDANLVTGAGATGLISHRTAGCWPARDLWGHHCSSGDLCSPGEASDLECETWGETLVMWNAGNLRVQSEGGLVDTRKYNLHSALYHCIMAKRLVHDKQASFTDTDESNVEFSESCVDRTTIPMERTMIWSEQEACAKQVTQISTSACGATAVINALQQIKMILSLYTLVKEGVNTRLRADSASLPEYLFSRSVAGATHIDIIRGLEHASDGALYARFFPMYPDRIVNLTHWLAHWMKKGAIPIATLNLQHGVAPGNPVPDAWHHQMVFGVGPRGVYLTNPAECISEAALWPQLCSPSVLMIRRNDILSRWNEHTNLRPFMNHPDPRWKKMNVLGQVVNIVRESTCTRSSTQGWVITQHVCIPAAYSSGITLVIRRESPAYEELSNAPELPLLQQQHQGTSKMENILQTSLPDERAKSEEYQVSSLLHNIVDEFQLLFCGCPSYTMHVFFQS
ncbi:hypothetical protein L9F63_010302, partial [Diploptera punctata]